MSASAQPAEGGAAGAGELRILAVTDNEPVRDELEFGFSESVRIEFAHDARDALRLLNKDDETFSAVVVDLQTGAAGGYSLASDMKATRALADVPIVILLERQQDAWLARRAGAHSTLLKPVTAAQVLTALGSHDLQ
ncbi:MAG: response regulator [Actinomycetota bacterium]